MEANLNSADSSSSDCGCSTKSEEGCGCGGIASPRSDHPANSVSSEPVMLTNISVPSLGAAQFAPYSLVADLQSNSRLAPDAPASARPGLSKVFNPTQPFSASPTLTRPAYSQWAAARPLGAQISFLSGKPGSPLRVPFAAIESKSRSIASLLGISTSGVRPAQSLVRTGNTRKLAQPGVLWNQVAVPSMGTLTNAAIPNRKASAALASRWQSPGTAQASHSLPQPRFSTALGSLPAPWSAPLRALSTPTAASRTPQGSASLVPGQVEGAQNRNFQSRLPAMLNAAGPTPKVVAAAGLSMQEPFPTTPLTVPNAPADSGACCIPGNNYNCCCTGDPSSLLNGGGGPAGKAEAGSRSPAAISPPEAKGGGGPGTYDYDLGQFQMGYTHILPNPNDPKYAGDPAAEKAKTAGLPGSGATGRPKSIPGGPGSQRLVDPNNWQRTGWWFPGFANSGAEDGGPIDLRGARVGQWSKSGRFIGIGSPPWGTGVMDGDGSGWIAQQF